MPWKIICCGRFGIAQTWAGEILRPGFLPLHHAESRRVKDDFSASYRHTRHKLQASIHACHTAVNVAELSVLFFEHSDIRFLPDRKRPQLRSADFVRRIDGRAPDYVF